MNRIMVVGSPGSGKSFFSTELSKKLNIPLYHLDNIWWNKDKTHISREEFDAKLKEIINKDKWIIDGDYSRTYSLRMEKADTIIFLDYPLDICIQGSKSRIGIKRDDIPWIENKSDNLELIEYIVKWRETTLPKLEELLNYYKDKKNILIFKSREETNEYLKSVANGWATLSMHDTMLF